METIIELRLDLLQVNLYGFSFEFFIIILIVVFFLLIQFLKDLLLSLILDPHEFLLLEGVTVYKLRSFQDRLDLRSDGEVLVLFVCLLLDAPEEPVAPRAEEEV